MADTVFLHQDKKITLRVRLTPNARKESIGGVLMDEHNLGWLKASVRAVPENGKANKALIVLLAKELGIAKTQISLVSGQTSRRKAVSLPFDAALVGKIEELAK